MAHLVRDANAGREEEDSAVGGQARGRAVRSFDEGGQGDDAVGGAGGEVEEFGGHACAFGDEKVKLLLGLRFWRELQGYARQAVGVSGR